jgi:hypothetical protein
MIEGEIYLAQKHSSSNYYCLSVSHRHNALYWKTYQNASSKGHTKSDALGELTNYLINAISVVLDSVGNFVGANVAKNPNKYFDPAHWEKKFSYSSDIPDLGYVFDYRWESK